MTRFNRPPYRPARCAKHPDAALGAYVGEGISCADCQEAFYRREEEDGPCIYHDEKGAWVYRGVVLKP